MGTKMIGLDGRRSWPWCVGVLLVGLCAAWPFAWFGYPLNTDDIRWHAIWVWQFLTEMQAGAFYPRWLHGMNAGSGSPTFFFYGPLSYWATSLASLAGGGAEPFRAISIVATVALCGSGMTAFLWLRSLAGPIAAAVGAALYIVLPYHLTVDYWTRSAFAEANAYVWTPLLFLGIEQMRGGRRTGPLLLSAGFALLVLTHIITAMLAGVVAGLYAILRFRSVGRLAAMGGAMLLGAGLAGFYLATAIGLKDGTDHAVAALEAGLFFPVAPEAQPRPQFVRLLLAIWAAEAVAVVVLAVVGFLSGRLRGVWFAWVAVLTVIVFSMTRLSMPVWNGVSVLQNAQFPFRMLALADLAVATAAALVAAVVLARTPRRGIAGTVALVLLGGFGAAQVIVPLRSGAFDRAASNWESKWTGQSDHGFFRPMESAGMRPTEGPLVSTSEGTAMVVGSGPRRYVIDVDVAAPARLLLRQFYFVGWEARIDGAALPLRAGPGGLVEVAVPAGRHAVTIVLTATRTEQAGWAISAVSAVVWLALLAWALRTRRVAQAAPIG